MDPSPLLQSANLELPLYISTDTNNDQKNNISHKTGQLLNTILNKSLSSSNPLNLTSKQLIQIKQILSSDNIGISEKSDPLTMCLKKNDNYLPKALAQSTLVKMFISFKCMFFIILIYISVLIIMGVNTPECIIFICEFNDKILPSFQLIFIVRYVIKLMHINRIAMYAVLKTFTFWFKLMCWFTVVTCFCYVNIKLGNWIEWVVITLMWILLTLVFLSYAFLDALYYDQKSKKIFLTTGTVLMIINAIGMTISEWDEQTDARILRLPYINYRIDIIAYMAGSMRTISLFVLKQTICFFWKPDHAILVRRRVKINWLS